MNTNTCSWPLGNGQTISFTIYSQNQDWNHVAGIYIFSFQTTTGWFPLYVGKAENFATRLPNHERLNEAVQRGATHIHAVSVPQEANRDKWEQMLIQHLQPPMNIQHR